MQNPSPNTRPISIPWWKWPQRSKSAVPSWKNWWWTTWRGKDVIIETSMAKYWTTEMAKRTADRALDLFGDAGILETCPIARAFRDVRVMSIFAGTNEIMKGIAAKFMGL